MADVRRGGSTLCLNARLGVYLQRRVRANLEGCNVVESLLEKRKCSRIGLAAGSGTTLETLLQRPPPDAEELRANIAELSWASVGMNASCL